MPEPTLTTHEVILEVVCHIEAENPRGAAEGARADVVMALSAIYRTAIEEVSVITSNELFSEDEDA